MSNSFVEDIKNKFSQGNTIVRLIMVNIAVHLTLALLYVILFLVVGNDIQSVGQGDILTNFMRNWFWFPSDFAMIPFRIWTVFTYMFLHFDIWHILGNMLILYIFGIRLTDLIQREHILPIYIWGGIAGAFAFSICFHLFPAFDDMQNSSHILGASASVMAIVFATSTLNPTGLLFFPFIRKGIEMRYIALFWVLLNVLIIPGGNPGGAFAHLGGAFMGWFFIIQLRKGRDLSRPINRFLNVFSSQRRTKKTTRGKVFKLKEYSTSRFAASAQRKTDYFGSFYSKSFMHKYKHMSKDECLNAILDKIKRSGFEGLSEDEKAFLDRFK